MDIRLKEILHEKGITSVSLANMVGLSKNTISNLVNNKTMPSIGTLNDIATALNVPVWQLLVSPAEITGESELTALIHYKRSFYKASTIDELDEIVEKIKKEKG